jgi:hypothetical protein
VTLLEQPTSATATLTEVSLLCRSFAVRCDWFVNRPLFRLIESRLHLLEQTHGLKRGRPSPTTTITTDGDAQQQQPLQQPQHHHHQPPPNQCHMHGAAPVVDVLGVSEQNVSS